MRHVGISKHERDVPARGRLRDEPERDPLERRHRAAKKRRIGPETLAYGADNRHLGLAASFGEIVEVVEDPFQPPCVVDGHRDADLRGRYYIDRGLEAFEHLEE